MSANMLSWSKRVSEVEIFLQAHLKNALLSYERLDRGNQPSEHNSDFAYINTLFTLKWNKDVFHGPQTMLVMGYAGKEWFIETYGYFTPTEEEKIAIRAARRADPIGLYTSKFEEVIRHKNIVELYAAMVEENARRQALRK